MHNTDLDYVRTYADRYGNHFFDADTMRFFNSRILPSSVVRTSPHTPRRVTYRMVTSERHDDNPRRYTVREFTINHLEERVTHRDIGEFQQYATRRDALRHLMD